jgi:outer membrane immunogenic protein
MPTLKSPQPAKTLKARSEIRPTAALAAIICYAATLLASPRGLAQQTHTLDLGANYSYVRANVLPGCNCFALIGGGVETQMQLTPHLSSVLDITLAHKGGITPDGYRLTQLTYTGGVRYSLQPGSARYRFFGELKFGGASAFGSLSPSNSGIGGGSNAFAFEPGGGLQVRLTPQLFLVPVHADYLLTTFNNGANNRQNDLSLSTGILLRFGMPR